MAIAPAISHPDNVTWFARLNYTSLLLGYGAALAGKPPETPGVFHGSAGQVFAMTIVTFGALVLVWLAASRRKNFARLLLVAIALYIVPLNLLGMLLGWHDVFHAGITIGIAGLAALAMQAAAAVLVCSPSAVLWFSAGNDKT